MHRWWRICLSHLICLCGGGGGPFVFKIRNLSHNCRPKIEIWNCWHHQKKHSSHIASQTSFKSTMIYLLLYGCIFNSVTRNQCSSVRNQEWDCGFLFPKMLGIFLKFYFSVCTYFMCTVHVYIYIGIVHIYMGIYVSSWFNCVCTCVYMNVKARGWCLISSLIDPQLMFSDCLSLNL